MRTTLPRYSRASLMNRYYELVLMLDPESADTDREKLADIRAKQAPAKIGR